MRGPRGSSAGSRKNCGEEQEAADRIREQIEKVRRRMLNPDELAGAVEAFDPVWDSLPPTYKARLVHLLVERIEYDGQNESIAITFHQAGIKTFAGRNHGIPPPRVLQQGGMMRMAVAGNERKPLP